MLIRLFWGCGAVTGAGPMGGAGLMGERANGGRADRGMGWGNGPTGERADGGRHGYPPLSYDVTDAVVC